MYICMYINEVCYLTFEACGSLCTQLVMGNTKKNRKYQQAVAHSDSWSLYQCR